MNYACTGLEGMNLTITKEIAIKTGTMMYAREIPKLSPSTPSKNGAAAIATPAANELLPIARSGRPSLKAIKRIDASANCIETPKPIVNSEIRLMGIKWENQKATKPRN